MKRFFSLIGGFLVLFLLYHLPEFFQQYYQQPLIWLLELSTLVLLIASYFIIKTQTGKGFPAFGLFYFARFKFNLIKGLVLGFLFAAAANLITVWLHWNTLYANFSVSQIILQTLIFAVGTILPSLAEDILTRGYLFAHWKQQWNKNLFVITSAVLFTLNHIFRLSNADVMIYIFILGLLLAWSLAYTRSLWLTFGIHWGSNVAYQFFTNVVVLKTVRETGYDNYLLAACYLAGWVIIIILDKLSFFRIARPYSEE